MFIPIEGEDCVFLEDVIALVHDEGVTTVWYGSGRKSRKKWRNRRSETKTIRFRSCSQSAW